MLLLPRLYKGGKINKEKESVFSELLERQKEEEETSDGKYDIVSTIHYLKWFTCKE